MNISRKLFEKNIWKAEKFFLEIDSISSMKEFLNIGKNIWPDSIWIGKEDILWKPFFEINIFNEWTGTTKLIIWMDPKMEIF